MLAFRGSKMRVREIVLATLVSCVLADVRDIRGVPGDSMR
jgi:hypothetical protein